VNRWPLVLVLGLALAGCGRGDDQRAVSAVTERFVRAVEAHNGDVACAQLSSETADALASDVRRAQVVAGLV
jgi:hypothetical protein